MSEPLYQKIQNDLIRRIQSGELDVGDLVPSEKELAEQYGVSQITSKNAIKGLVDEGLLVRYRGKGTFVRAFGDRPASELKALAEHGAATIALVIPSMKTRIDQQLLDSLEKHCASAGYELLIRITRENPDEEARAIERFRNRGVDGFIVFPVEQNSYNETILRLSLDRIPLVLVDRFLKEIKTYSVSSDNMGGVKEAVEDLLARGHRKIAYLSPEITNTATDDRARGYEAAFIERGLPIDKTLWCLLPLPSIVAGMVPEYILSFLREHRDVTAIFAVNAEIARYAYEALREMRGQSARETMPELVTFDDSGLEGLTYISQQVDEIGRLTVGLLSEQLSGRFEPRREIVPVQVIRP
ncbi:GntR family transcriptional regulator [Paenibacillus sp. N4]|uniref:GntR family transcriptional regulator n=1 Tax=Paenibacillus vietnamensis TaxID=2590547 RepID=UPI001CD10BB3|nr:GntR family transcriptional regulator [Paenibacillus vietnamensis]MCA0755971.1 GntR family transcriptional regulator [Paenibacillus vietnamensis]